MKCIVLLSFVALCYSYPLGTGYGSGFGKGYGQLFGSGLGYGTGIGYGSAISTSLDGSITITAPNGKIVTISKGVGPNIGVGVTVPTGGLGNQFYYMYKKYQPTQGDILAQIVSQYQGDVSLGNYQQLLQDVSIAVQSGQLSQDIYQTLLSLYQNQVGQYQGSYLGGQVVPLQGQVVPLQGQVVPLQGQVVPLQGQVGVLGGQYQGYPYGSGIQQQIQYPYGQVVGTTQQGQLLPQSVLYPTVSGVSGIQGVLGQGVGTGKSYLNQLISKMLYGSGQYPVQYGQYSQYSQVVPSGQLSQIVQGEGQILNQENQIQQQQYQQQLQQQQLLNQQQYIQQLQQQQEQEQEQVLVGQQQVQQQQYNTLYNMLLGITPVQSTIQQTGFVQQQPGVYSQGGLYGVYGPGIQGYNIPLVY